MESKSKHAPIIIVAGATASGKSAIGLELAQRFNGEIVAADSRTVYKDMDIGTAKPSAIDRKHVQHHLLNVATPDHPITAAQFKVLADAAIDDIMSRSKLPIIVGGTGLYVDAIAYDFRFVSQTFSAQKRQDLEALTTDELQTMLQKKHISLPNNFMNKRHLIRQLETGGIRPVNSTLRPGAIVLRIDVGTDELKERIATRVRFMFEHGLEEEVLRLASKYGWDIQPMRSIGYQEFRLYADGQANLKDVYDKIVYNTFQYAKRQRTWFRRHKSAYSICNVSQAVDIVTTLLNK